MVNMILFKDVYRGKKVLVTGNTGFKGSWLSLWLTQLGASVVGVSIDVPTKPSLHQLLKIEYPSESGDVRNLNQIKKIIDNYKPDIIFHLAAQSLVRPSYHSPQETFDINVMGTANVLEAVRKSSSVKACVIVTSDKCYENVGSNKGYREDDKLGGRDPYSASKGCAEIVTNSYRQSFFEKNGALVASVRAGNVVGGGDWSEDRLIPDIIRAVDNHQPLELRNPHATRPWQHVLDPLSGYLLVGQHLLDNERDQATAYNFGPQSSNSISVEEVVKQVQTVWRGFEVKYSDNDHPHEAAYLRLDSSKALRQLKWKSNWSFETSLEKTVGWYDKFMNAKYQAIDLCFDDINNFQAAASNKGLVWLEN